MAVPGDVDAAVCAKLAIPRVGMDEIVRHAEQSRAARLVEAAPAREQVDRRARRAAGPVHGALLRPAVRRAAAALSAHGAGRRQAAAQEGPERARATTERAAIETWAEVLARRFAHIPCLGLRGLLHDGPDGSLEAFLGGLEPEFADELRAALKARPRRRASRRRRPRRARAATVKHERARELRLGTRGSELARTQSGTIAAALERLGFAVELTIIKTSGDQNTTSAFALDRPARRVRARDRASARRAARRARRALVQGPADEVAAGARRSRPCRRASIPPISCSCAATRSPARPTTGCR